MLKRWMFLIVLLLMIPSYVFAQDIPERPTTAGYVFDYQNVIDDGVEEEINEIARLLQSEGIMELMVVTVPTIGDLEPYEYGMQFFREWGIGDTEKDNGLLTYATTDMGEGNNVVRISTGYGLEGDYPDSVTNDFIQDYMKESLKVGDYTQAFANVVDAIRVKESVDYTWSGPVVPNEVEEEAYTEYEETTLEKVLSFIMTGGFLLVLLVVLLVFGLGVLYGAYGVIVSLYRLLQGVLFNMVEAIFKKDIRTKGYIRYAEEKERKRLEREAEEERKRLEREQKKEEYLAMLTAGTITQSQYDEKMAKLLGVSAYGSYEAPYDHYSYDSSSSSSDDYSYGGGDSGGGGSDSRF